MAAEAATAGGAALHLRLAVDYSAREAIRTGVLLPFAGALLPPVDLLIRTGGEQRLSDFLLWECAYAELHFTPLMWPDFTEKEFRHALDEFQLRAICMYWSGAGISWSALMMQGAAPAKLLARHAVKLAACAVELHNCDCAWS